jgi:Tol biopolymer transport system component
MGFANQFEEIFTMNSSGKKVTQITYSGSDYMLREIPAYYNNHFFFMSAGIWSVNSDGSNEIELAKDSNEGFSISGDGTIAYINYNKNGLNPILDHTHGTLWLMNADGTNKRQITTNNY